VSNLDVVERVRRQTGAKRPLERRRARRVADARAAVDVVRPDDGACEFLREVVLLVRRACGPKDPDAIGAIAIDQRAEPLGDEPTRFVP
jgi:hypothetical protein